MATEEQYHMARTRALLTETEREQVAGEHADKRRYEAVSRVRRRIKDELTKDVELLEEHHPKLLAELLEVVSPVTGDVWGAALALGIKEDGFYINDVMNYAGLEECHEKAIQDALKEMANKGWLRRSRNETDDYRWTLEKHKIDELREALCNGGKDIEDVE